MSETATTLKAYKRAPSHESSRWYMGNLITFLAEEHETDGHLTLMEVVFAPGNEPPPHVHSREDEMFYVLEGEFDVYVGDEAFKVKQGECVFLPRFVPHAFKVRSPRLHLLAILTPGGLEESFLTMSSAAERIELPTEMETYLTTDLSKRAQVLRPYGVRLLSAEEVPSALPLYPR